jgi:hypothetical protein
VPYFEAIIPTGTAVGQTFDAKIGKAIERVTLLGEMTVTEDGQTTMHVLKVGKAASVASATLPAS